MSAWSNTVMPASRAASTAAWCAATAAASSGPCCQPPPKPRQPNSRRVPASCTAWGIAACIAACIAASIASSCIASSIGGSFDGGVGSQPTGIGFRKDDHLGNDHRTEGARMATTDRPAHRLAILDDYQDVALDLAPWDTLQDVEVVVFHDPLPTAGDVVAALEGFDVVVAMRERTAFGADVIAGLPGLRLLVTTGMANAAIDLDAAAAAGVTVCGTQGSPTAAPEHTWALLMAWMRDIPAQQASLRDGRWQTGRSACSGWARSARASPGTGPRSGWTSSRGASTWTPNGPRRPGPGWWGARSCSPPPTCSACTCACPSAPA